MNQLPIEDLSLHDFFENIPLGIIIFDSDYNIKLVNGNFYRFSVLKQIDDNFLSEKNILEETLFENIDLFYELKKLAAGESFEKEVKTFDTIAGGEITVLVKGSPFFVNRQYTGGVIILEDIQIGLEVQREKIIRSKYFTDFLSNMSDYFFIADITGKIKFFPERHGFISSDFLKENFLRDEDGSYRVSSNNTIQRLIEDVVKTGLGKSADLPMAVDGKDRIINLVISPFLDKFTNVQFITLLFKDVTSAIKERINLENENNELRKYYHLTSSIPEAVIALDLNGKIIYWNDAAYRTFGFGKSEVLGKYFGNILGFFNKDKFNAVAEKVRSGEIWTGVVTEEISEERLEHYSLKIMWNDSPGQASLLIVCSIVTEEIIKQQKLAASENLLYELIENAAEMICSVNEDGNLLFANTTFLKKLHLSSEDIKTINFTDVIDPDFMRSANFDLKGLSEADRLSRDLVLIDKNGNKLYVMCEFTLSGIKSEGLRYNILITDKSDQKKIVDDNILMNLIFDYNCDGIVILDNNHIVRANKLFVNISGYDDVSQILGLDISEALGIKEFNEVFTKEFDRQNTKIINEFNWRNKKGKQIYIELTARSLSEFSKNYMVLYFNDISKTKSEQTALKTAEERYTSIAEIINEFMWFAERQNDKLETVFYTDAVKRITGYTNEEFLANNRLWYKIIHPNDLSTVFARLKRLYSDEARSFDEIEYRIFNNLGSIIWVKNKVNVLRDEKGIIYRIIGLVSDITLSKRAEEELKKSAENLKQMNETKDRFISIVSHDLRTPFSSILGFTDLLLNDRTLPEDKQIQYITYIQESSRNMLSLVNSLLDWTRLQTGRINFEPERVSARLIVVKAVQMLSGNALTKNINLTSEISDDVFIHADENLLIQAFMNLISNAIKFTGTGGSITISSTASIEKKQILFSVRDSGTGIKKEDIKKLFRIDTKFTTSGTAGERGSGLGLSLVHDIIKKHGGDIWVESEVGKGSEFKFTIPVSSSRILLVDDGRTDRLLYSKLLKSLIPNYSIVEAGNGSEALEIIKHSPPALVITDHKMPIMDGYEFVKQLHLSDINYKPPVIVLSSDLDSTLVDEYKELGVEFIFKKPVDLMTFKFSVEKSLKKALFV